mmetsp:Transcript_55674/g.148033  ORF Transcript_55674/g.148033 Transcript_55674/m.148033 type:complete len:241 (+) Transcript_55674:67-789(+)
MGTLWQNGARLTNKRVGYFTLLTWLFLLLWHAGPLLQRRFEISLAACLRASLALTTTLLSAIGMEYYARFAHRSLWHGPESSRWWLIHRTHHTHKSESDVFELNDIYSLINIPLVVGPMLWVTTAAPSLPRACLLGYTVGVSAFGTAYMVVHDGVHHRRFPVGPLARVPLVKRIADAHAEHHKSAMGPPFGMFLGPEELVAEAEGRAPAPPPRWLLLGLKATAAFTVAGLAWELCAAAVA